jgi:hypothetical protein
MGEGPRFELRVDYRRASTSSWVTIAVITIAFIVTPTRYWWGNWLAGICIIGLMLYPIIYMRKTRLVVEDGWIRFYDLQWPEQSMAVREAAGIRRDQDGFWAVYSMSGEVVRIRSVWTREKMNELARLLNVPIEGWGQDWRYSKQLSGPASYAFSRWLRVRAKLADHFDQAGQAPFSRSDIAKLLELRRREIQLWERFRRSAGGGG